MPQVLINNPVEQITRKNASQVSLYLLVFCVHTCSLVLMWGLLSVNRSLGFSIFGVLSLVVLSILLLFEVAHLLSKYTNLLKASKYGRVTHLGRNMNDQKYFVIDDDDHLQIEVPLDIFKKLKIGDQVRVEYSKYNLAYIYKLERENEKESS